MQQHQTQQRTQQTQDGRRGPAATGQQHRTERRDGPRLHPDNQVIGTGLLGQRHGYGREYDGYLPNQLVLAGQSHDPDSEGDAELQDAGLRGCLEDAHLLHAIGSPGGELEDGESDRKDDAAQVATGSLQPVATPKAEATQGEDFAQAHPCRQSRTEVQPDTQEDHRGDRQGSPHAYGPPGPERKLTLQVRRRQ